MRGSRSSCRLGTDLRRFGISRATFIVGLLFFALAIAPRPGIGANLADEALASFPPQTIRVEYSSPARLRALPNYESLRQRYLGAALAKLEVSLTQLGVTEGDVDELILGWRPSSAGMDLYGFGTGRFNTATIAARAKERNLEPENLSGHTIYCLEAGLSASCVAILDKSLGAFGTLGTLSSLLDARGGSAVALNTSSRFVTLMKSARTAAPIWGVALGPAASDWFKGWMPGQGNIQLDWSRVFQGVEGMSYSVDAGDKVALDLKMDCTSSEAASGLRQVLEGLKLAQQLAWQTQNPNQPNPFESVGVESSDRQVALKLTTGYASLQAMGAVGAP